MNLCESVLHSETQSMFKKLDRVRGGLSQNEWFAQYA